MNQTHIDWAARHNIHQFNPNNTTWFDLPRCIVKQPLELVATKTSINMADLNTGSRNIVREEHEDLPTPNVPGAFPGESNKSSSALSANIVVPQTQPVISGEPAHLGRDTASPRSATHPGQDAPIVTSINDQSPSAYTAHASHPTGGIQPSLKKVDDEMLASAAEEQVLEQVACPIEARPADKQAKVDAIHDNKDTVTAGELAQEIAASATSAAAAAAKAAQEAAAWATNKAVENYPAARDTTLDAAAAAGETTQSAVQNAASALPDSVKNALGTTTTAATGNADANPPLEKVAPGVPAAVQASLERAGESPEAAANPEAVQDKQTLESQLLTIAKAAGVDTEEEQNALKGTPPSTTSDIPAHKGAGTVAAVGALAGGAAAVSHHQQKPSQPNMPQRAESTDYVKILGTETIRHQIHASDNSTPGQSGTPTHPLSQSQNAGNASGTGVGAVQRSPAHGGGPAGGAPEHRSAVAAPGHLGSQAHDDMPASLQAKQRHDSSPSTIQSNAAAISSAAAAGGIGHGLSTFSHRAEEPTQNQSHSEHPRSTGTAAQAPGHGIPTRRQPSPPSYGQSQDSAQNYSLSSGADSGISSGRQYTNPHSGVDSRISGRNEEQPINVEYNKLGSGTVSGVADPHSNTK
ncbi:hypothetical protein MCOR27_007160 [Pyricularia oryzae]|uniref:Uncharacterized protein n=2 Tax=Pyricularia TaxID=48558 RepID=A0ABQ8NXE8_PYRGI|nr:hypothetical protein MCOR01_003219 [Pyricularia oryzae]KAI6303537.1 hypothetical protein MCOR33_001416 [Pyricularia grisea]KAI6257455.1 hypothetical protein MCOR19_006140 [Pyricularia oryzae]KAI6275068.1 hypothetical protein MCOR27_007160 [Pyricularia oryzae]KAI6279786.1 hypothetical protein MCOR26_004075 [Pyricularia oryzae]